MKKLPLIDEKSQEGVYPYGKNSSKCPLCGASFKRTGWASLCGGGRSCDKEGNTKLLNKGTFIRSSLSIGFHGSENIPSSWRKGYDEAYEFRDIVRDMPGQGFDLNFCSIRCLRNWFNMILDDFVREFRDKYGYDP